jgi:catechol 1,2-dioxygenase
MSAHIFNTQEVQDFLRLASGLNQEGGNPRAKQIIHRILSDLYKAIEDLDITSDEYWAGVAYLNQLGARGEAGLLSPGLGFDRYFDMRRASRAWTTAATRPATRSSCTAPSTAPTASPCPAPR